MIGSQTISGLAYPLDLDNVDTDQIIAGIHLKTILRSGLSQFAFETLRHERATCFDDPQFRDASILVVGANFGCGSSREHAVWALQDMGIRAVIATSFADIFASNALKCGLATIVVSRRSCERLLKAATALDEISIELARRMITAPGFFTRFAMDRFVAQRLISGLDEIAETLSVIDRVEAFERGRGEWLRKAR